MLGIGLYVLTTGFRQAGHVLACSRLAGSSLSPSKRPRLVLSLACVCWQG